MQVGTCYEQISNKYTAIAVAIISSDIFIHFADKTAATPPGSKPLNTSSTCFGGELSSTPSPSAGTPFGSEPVSASSTLSRGEPSNAHSLPVGALTFTESGTSSTPFTSTGTPEPTSIFTDAVPASNPSPHGPPSSTPRSTPLSTYFASASTGMPTREEPTNISAVSDLTTVLPPEPTTDGGPTSDGGPTTDGGHTTDGEPTTDSDTEHNDSGELQNGSTPQSDTTGEYGVLDSKYNCKGELTE